ncbi:hypothetical protein [Streptomyces sp. Inha503]|uniref:hypothetical protein n=1 Tax=Streptomyces sp. Inha503 TaxID=3383314 RepID=UPI00399FD2B1
MSVDWAGWPVLHVHAVDLPQGEARALVVRVLEEALERDEPFGAAVEMPWGAPAERGGDEAVQQVRAVRSLRPRLAERCRGLVFVLPVGEQERHAKVLRSGDQVWGCPTMAADTSEAARDWLRSRLEEDVV